MKKEYGYMLAQFALTFGIFFLLNARFMSWQWWATVALTAGLMIVSYQYGWHRAERWLGRL
jgi:hypothetical protein